MTTIDSSNATRTAGRSYEAAYDLDRIEAGDSVLMEGHQGASVRAAQEKLIEGGYLPAGSADGKFGPRTRDAAERFQADHGLKVDGKVGPKTYAELFETETQPAAAPAADAAPVDEIGTEARDEYVEQLDALIDLRTRAADGIVQEDWSDDVVGNKSERRELADRKRAALEVVEEAAATLDPERREEIDQLTQELQELYGDLDGGYVISDPAYDAARAGELEHQIENLVRGGR